MVSSIFAEYGSQKLLLEEFVTCIRMKPHCRSRITYITTHRPRIVSTVIEVDYAEAIWYVYPSVVGSLMSKEIEIEDQT